MGILDYIVIAVIAAWFVAAVIALVKRKGGCGCGCSGNCSHDAAKCAKCKKKEKKQ